MEWILNAAMIIFMCMELSNVVIMYFKPDFKYGNSMLAFKNYAEHQKDEKNRLFIKYLVNWVANCKLIFLVLLLVVLIVGTPEIKAYSLIAMILSIGIYFVTLFPFIRKLDQMGEIQPKGYSKTLSFMILGFMILFTVALILYYTLS